jgi:hypothetical protein
VVVVVVVGMHLLGMMALLDGFLMFGALFNGFLIFRALFNGFLIFSGLLDGFMNCVVGGPPCFPRSRFRLWDAPKCLKGGMFLPRWLCRGGSTVFFVRRRQMETLHGAASMAAFNSAQ